MKNAFLSEMTSRGFLNQCTDLDGLNEVSNKKPIKIPDIFEYSLINIFSSLGGFIIGKLLKRSV